MAKTRAELLALAVDYVADHGTADFSLRSCAEAIGTSHRMLGYHFGSREGLLRAITEAVAEEIREAIMQARSAGEPLARSWLGGSPDQVRRRARLFVESGYLRWRAPQTYGSYAEALEVWAPVANLITGSPTGDGPLSPRGRALLAGLFGLTFDLACGAAPDDIESALHELVELHQAD